MTNERKAFREFFHAIATTQEEPPSSEESFIAGAAWQKSELLKMLDDPAMVVSVTKAIMRSQGNDPDTYDDPEDALEPHLEDAVAALSTIKQMMENLPAFSIDTNQ